LTSPCAAPDLQPGNLLTQTGAPPSFWPASRRQQCGGAGRMLDAIPACPRPRALAQFAAHAQVGLWHDSEMPENPDYFRLLTYCGPCADLPG
jgi:hypothetical protein